MQPDRTLIQLVSWINIIEDHNDRLVAALKAEQDKSEKLSKQVDELKEKLAGE